MMTNAEKIKKIRQKIISTHKARHPDNFSGETRALIIALILNSQLIADIMDIFEEKH